MSQQTTEPQHMQALGAANRVRVRIGQVKRMVRDGTMTVREAFDDPAMAKQLVTTVLEAQMRWGAQRASKTLKDTPISETRRVGTLTEREKDRLVAKVAGRNNGWKL